MREGEEDGAGGVGLMQIPMEPGAQNWDPKEHRGPLFVTRRSELHQMARLASSISLTS